ncbi:hypothetical protein B566_EDAN011018 [Ephemera danica]|nr:hypothetical protein B566_EDAN011018 [Ephemera danica]
MNQLLGANADIPINNITARKLIATKYPDLLEKLTEPEDIKVPDVPSHPLFVALYHENEQEFLQLLKNESLSVDIDNGKETLLQLAVTKKYETAVKKLLEKGAGVNKVSGFSLTGHVYNITEWKEDIIERDRLQLQEKSLSMTYDSTVMNYNSSNFTTSFIKEVPESPNILTYIIGSALWPNQKGRPSTLPVMMTK